MLFSQSLKYWQDFSFFTFQSELVSIENVQFHGSGKFPEVVTVAIGYEDDRIFLRLERDDDTTAMLNEDLFETSRILPTGVFKAEHSEVR